MISRYLLDLDQLRESLGSTPLMDTARKVASQLAQAGIPHLIVGGLAVQQHGYPRTTVDVDIVVPDVARAREHLSIHGFQEQPGSSMTLKDRANRVEVDLLPGGGSVGPSILPLPVPTEVSPQPVFISLPGLISQKLSTHARNPKRLRDLADVVELIQRAGLPRKLEVDPAVRADYQRHWDQYA